MSHLDEGLFHAALDGELTEAERTAMDAHLAACAPCRARFDEAVSYRDTARGLILALDPVAAPSAAAPSTVQVTPIDVARARRRPWPLVVAWAATILGAVGLGYRMGGRDQATTEIALAPTTTTAPRVLGEEARLADEVPSETDPPKETRQPARRAVGASATTTAPAESFRREAKSELASADAEPAPATPPRSDRASERDSVLDQTGRTAANDADPRPSPVRFRSPPAAGARAAGAVAAEEPGGAASRPLARDLLKLDGPVSPNPADQRRREISAVAAIAALGGSMRLVDGLVPSRFESQGDIVRVVYRTAHGPLVLEQWRAGELLAHELIAPPTAPTDSVQAWEKRIR